MITDKQFDDSFTAAGGWFVAVYYETVADWRDEKSKLVDKILAQSFFLWDLKTQESQML